MPTLEVVSQQDNFLFQHDYHWQPHLTGCFVRGKYQKEEEIKDIIL